MKKTTLILGAGFSKLAGYPLQKEIFAEVDKFYKRDSVTLDSKNNWNKVRDFFENFIGVDIKRFLIEDLFTILDKCVIDEEYFKEVNLSDIEDVRIALIVSIRDYFNQMSTNMFNEKDRHTKYVELAETILTQREMNGKKDKLAIISLNWDTLFEQLLQYYSGKYDKVSLDYCTYNYDFSNNKGIPSVLKKSHGYKNLKVLKPHGSTNWGYCPNCKRLYISFGEKMNSKSGEKSRKFECIKYCNVIYKKGIPLVPVLITPTFLKEIGNYHLKNIWSNIGIELQESDRVIIIGYSLRPEDFNFRFMLSKFIKSDCEIHVYDYIDAEGSKKTNYENIVKKRYKDFLQKNNIIVNVDGWESMIGDIKSLISV